MSLAGLSPANYLQLTKDWYQREDLFKGICWLTNLLFIHINNYCSGFQTVLKIFILCFNSLLKNYFYLIKHWIKTTQRAFAKSDQSVKPTTKIWWISFLIQGQITWVIWTCGMCGIWNSDPGDNATRRWGQMLKDKLVRATNAISRCGHDQTRRQRDQAIGACVELGI